MMSRSKTLLSMAGILVAGTLLSGCVGGTTYGTGVTQEQQTIEDLANLVTFRKKRERINYKARPDLVVPEEKVLVAPVDETASLDDQEWPETPEERIARIREEAEAANSGDTAQQNRFARSDKRFRSVQPINQAQGSAPIGEGIPDVTCDTTGNSTMRRCTGDEISKAVRAARAEIRSVGKTGYQRRYLTEPPIEYRTPSNTAPVGDEGYTEAELARIEAEEKQRRLDESMRPNG